MSAKVIDMFGVPIGERIADKVIPPEQTPGSIAEFADAGQLQVERDRRVDRIGTWTAVAAGFIVFFLVRDWRSKRHVRPKS